MGEFLRGFLVAKIHPAFPGDMFFSAINLLEDGDVIGCFLDRMIALQFVQGLPDRIKKPTIQILTWFTNNFHHLQIGLAGCFREFFRINPVGPGSCNDLTHLASPAKGL